MHQRRGQIEAATHAAGVRGDAPVERVAEIDQLAELRDAPIDDARFGSP